MNLPIVICKDGKLLLVETTTEIESKPDQCILVAKNGVLLHNNTPGYTLVKESKGKGLELDEVKENCSYAYPPVNFNTYMLSLRFLRKVYEIHKSEGVVLLVLNRNRSLKNQKYQIVVPKQEVSGASVDYKEGIKEAHKLLNTGEFFAGTIHSHPGFGAFQSSTDSSDELNFDGIHITLGKIDQEHPEIHQRVCFGGKSFDVKESIVQTMPPNIPQTFPEEWMKQISSKTRQIGFEEDYDGAYGWGHLHGNYKERDGAVIVTNGVKIFKGSVVR